MELRRGNILVFCCRLINEHLIILVYNSYRKSRAKKGNVGRPPGSSKRRKGDAQEGPAQEIPINRSPGPVTRR